ncbi:MAG TPA: hypothetical protein VF867_03165 [Arthrobacter sp.]
MINYPFIIEAIDYVAPVKAGFFRRKRARPATLELVLVMPEWANYDSPRYAVVRLTGPDAEAWRRLVPTDKIRVYGQPAPGESTPFPPVGRVLLDITRLQRGHMNFLDIRSHELKEVIPA